MTPSRRGRVASAAWALACVGAASAAPPKVDWDGVQLCVRADDAPRAEVLREVARKTGVTIKGSEQLSDRVTLARGCADLASTLRTLAGNASYALTEFASPAAGAGTQYELYFAAPGRARPNILVGQPNVSVLVEDATTGEMRAVTRPSSKGDAITARPDAQRVSVHVEAD